MNFLYNTGCLTQYFCGDKEKTHVLLIHFIVQQKLTKHYTATKLQLRQKYILLFWCKMFYSVQFSQSCLTLCDSMNLSMPGLPVYHQHPESTQTHVHQVSDVIQPSHPLSSPSPPAPNTSQHQGLFQ